MVGEADAGRGMRKILDDHIKALEAELIDHAAKFPAGKLSSIPQWQDGFDRVRANIDRLKHARGLIPPTAAYQPLPV